MDKHDYLSRIQYAGSLSPSLTVLSALQEAHLLSVPFENLDIHAGTKIVLALPTLFQKVVVMRRGGFCYELNALYHWLLRELGFHARLAMGKVYHRDRNNYGPDFDHMLVLATISGETWIVDVGFGDFSMHPLQFKLNHPLKDANGTFLIESDRDEYFRVSRYSQNDQRYIPDYIFSTRERQVEDFSEMCLYHQISPESHFTQTRICTVATARGRITLTERKLVIREKGVRIESPIASEEAFRRTLAQYFSIVLP